MSTPPKSPKPSRDWPSIIASTLLSFVCLVVGTIHFLSSGGKADFVLITLIVICFAPWLGHVFESIGKDGLKWRVRSGEASEPPPEATSVAARVESSAEVKKNPVSLPADKEKGITSETVDATRRPGSTDFHASLSPNIREAVLASLEPDFDDLPVEAKKVLATLWNNQRAFFPDHVNGRWTFLVNPATKDGTAFNKGAALLQRYGIAGFASNGQLALTDHGIVYCKRQHEALNRWPDWYTTFDN